MPGWTLVGSCSLTLPILPYAGSATDRGIDDERRLREYGSTIVKYPQMRKDADRARVSDQ
jgi:hypothetical protein